VPLPDARRPTAAGNTTAVAIRTDTVTKAYGTGPGAVHALRGVTVSIPVASFTAVMGPSGSGKSTFLHCAAGLDRPTSGSVYLAGQDLARLSEAKLTRLRRDRIGFVFQSFNLVSSLTVWQNVGLPARLAGKRMDRAWAREILDRVGLGERLAHRPGELSGGQQQRVAIARTLIARPEVMFADEPTGALDTETGRGILGLLRIAVDTYRQTIVMVTHDPVAASYADRVLFLADGRLVHSLDRPTAGQVATWLSERGRT
jgi:putative ABC transport system ATP-binding protein